MKRAVWGLAFAAIGAATSAQAIAEMTYGADVVAYANVFPPDLHGGEGQRVAEWQVDTGPIDIGTPITYFTQWAQARAYASSQAYQMKAEALGAVTLWEMCDPCSASTPFAWSRARYWDTVTIPAGRYPNGTVIQVDVVAKLSGNVTLHGTPSGGSEWRLNAYFGPSFGMAPDNLFALDAYSGGLLPTQVHAVGPMTWTERVNVAVGGTYRLWGELLAHVGDSGFYGYGLGHYENSIDFYQSASVGLRYAPGYEDVTFISAAGAEVMPVPEPERYALILAGLGLIWLAAKHRGMD